MSVYDNYNNYWNNIKNIILKKEKFSLDEIYDITFSNECGEINTIIHNGKYIDINNDHLKKLNFLINLEMNH